MKFTTLLLDFMVFTPPGLSDIVSYYLESIRDGFVVCFDAAANALGNFCARLFSIFS